MNKFDRHYRLITSLIIGLIMTSTIIHHQCSDRGTETLDAEFPATSYSDRDNNAKRSQMMVLVIQSRPMPANPIMITVGLLLVT